MENLLRPLIVVGGSVMLTLVIGWATDFLLRKADERHHETPCGACSVVAASPTCSSSSRPC